MTNTIALLRGREEDHMTHDARLTIGERKR